MHEAKEDGDRLLFAACLDRETVVFAGKRETVAAAVKRAKDGKKVAELPGMKRASADVDPNCLAWVAVAITEDLQSLLKQFNCPPGLQAVTVHAHLGERGVVRLCLLTKDRDSADQWQAFLGRQLEPVREPARANGIAFSGARVDDSITVRVTAPVDTIRQLLATVK